jgi:hypothetical protein
MRFKLLLMRQSGIVMLIFGLGLAAIILAACGSAPAESGSVASLPATTAVETGKVVQPAVVAQGRNSQGGKIDFTGAPITADGVPVFLMFETEN